MCLYPSIIRNPRYKPNKQNGGFVPEPRDPRVLSVPIGCGVCKECLQKKRSNWLIRLQEEIKTNHYGYMVTLTFSENSLNELAEAAKSSEGNTIAKLAIKRFLERWRKKYGKSIRHWLVTEHGHRNTERIHLHGLLFTEQNLKSKHHAGLKDEMGENRETIGRDGKPNGITSTTCLLAQIWQYGNVHIGTYVSAKTINYIIKYVTKRDEKHPGYTPTTLCSPGIGKSYMNSPDHLRHQYKERETEERYKLEDGRLVGLPMYYRNKLWDSHQREDLWCFKLDKNERWVLGMRIDITHGEMKYYEALKWAQAVNIREGYDEPKKWKKQKYAAARRFGHIERNEEEINRNILLNLECSKILQSFAKESVMLNDEFDLFSRDGVIQLTADYNVHYVKLLYVKRGESLSSCHCASIHPER